MSSTIQAITTTNDETSFDGVTRIAGIDAQTTSCIKARRYTGVEDGAFAALSTKKISTNRSIDYAAAEKKCICVIATDEQLSERRSFPTRQRGRKSLASDDSCEILDCYRRARAVCRCARRGESFEFSKAVQLSGKKKSGPVANPCQPVSCAPSRESQNHSNFLGEATSSGDQFAVACACLFIIIFFGACFTCMTIVTDCACEASTRWTCDREGGPARRFQHSPRRR